MGWDGGLITLLPRGPELAFFHCVFCRVEESGLADLVTRVFSKFFGQANGAKGKPAPAQQTKLSFSTKGGGKKDGETAAEVKEEVEEEKGMSLGGVGLCGERADVVGAETGKRRARPAKGKKEVVEEEEDAEVVAPARKRPRRGRKVVEDEEDEDMEDLPEPKPNKAKPAAPKPKSPRKKPEPAPITKTAAEEDTPESASEVEEEELQDDEEKPEVVAKARQKVQASLTSEVKHPYPDWKAGEPVPYAALCTTFSLVELTTKRLEIMAHCALFLRQVLRLTPDDLLPIVLLMINKLAPDYAGIELGIGESLIMKAIGESTGRSLAVIKQDQKEIGDLGLVAVKSRSTQPTMFKPKPLTVQGVLKGLMGIATVTGNGAQGRKVDGIKKLLSAADANGKGKVDITKDKGGPSEAKYLVRFLEGKLRLGLAERTVIVSLAQAMVAHEAAAKGAVPSTGDLEKGEAILKTVYRLVCPSHQSGPHANGTQRAPQLRCHHPRDGGARHPEPPGTLQAAPRRASQAHVGEAN